MNQEEVEEKVLPLLAEVLRDRSNAKLKNDISSLQLLASEVIGLVHEAGFLSSKAAAEHVLPLAMAAMSSNDSEARLGWKAALEGLMPLLGAKVLEAEILPFALDSCQVSKAGELRLVGASLIGPLSRNLPVEVLMRVPAVKGAAKGMGQDNSVFKRGLALCQDTDHIVRSCMCHQLSMIASALVARSKDAKDKHEDQVEELSSIKDEILELLCDEEKEVREAAVAAAVELMTIVPQRLRSSMLDPLTELYEKAKKDSEDIVMLTNNLGQLVVQEWKSLGDKQVTVYKQFLSRVAGCSNNEARSRLAYVLPGILYAMGQNKYYEHLHNIVNILAKDTDVHVRMAMARSVEGIVSQLEQSTATAYAREVCITFLKDKDKDVKLAFIRGLPVIINKIVVTDDRRNDELLGPLVALHEQIQGNHAHWRQEIYIMESFDIAGPSFTASQVQDVVVPAILKTMAVSSPKVVAVGIKAVMGLVRLSRNAAHRSDICQKLNREWGRATSYTKRMMFCDICMVVLQYFSRNFFKYFFIDTALEMLRDSVPNVRCRACRLLPAIKQSLKLPYDAVLLENLINSMMRLQKDKDSDVVLAARQVSDEVHKMEELKPAGNDSEDDARRADEDTVHGHLERKHHKTTHALDLASDKAHKALPLKGAAKGADASNPRKAFNANGTPAVDAAAARKLFQTGNSVSQSVGRTPKLGAKQGSFARAKSSEGHLNGHAGGQNSSATTGVRRAGSSNMLHTAQTGKTSTAATTAVQSKAGLGSAATAANAKASISSHLNGKSSQSAGISRFGGLPTGPSRSGSAAKLKSLHGK